MKQWKYEVDVSDVWRDENIPLSERAKIISERIKKAVPWSIDSDELHVLADELADQESIEDFDAVWSQIYDWADVDKRLWINVWKAFAPKETEQTA